jgi:aminoacyl tRNA synthase complex-interacting multifunctional protein 1
MSSESKKNAIDLINELISDLEAKIGHLPKEKTHRQDVRNRERQRKDVKDDCRAEATNDLDLLPNICKLEIKVGKIVKIWAHPESEKLYCEEIDVGEDSPRPIVSGLRAHYATEDLLLGKKVLVVTNLKPKKLAGVVSNVMVLCVVSDGEEVVELLEPPDDAPVGEVVHFQGLPSPSPYTPSQIEKKKIFQACVVDMKTTIHDGSAVWKENAFLTNAGPCKSKSCIQGGAIR